MIDFFRYKRDKTCPFCRKNLKKMKPADLWVLVDHREIVDSLTVCKENLKRLCIFIDKLPLVTGTVTGAGACNHRIRRWTTDLSRIEVEEDWDGNSWVLLSNRCHSSALFSMMYILVRSFIDFKCYDSYKHEHTYT